MKALIATLLSFSCYIFGMEKESIKCSDTAISLIKRQVESNNQAAIKNLLIEAESSENLAREQSRRKLFDMLFPTITKEQKKLFTASNYKELNFYSRIYQQIALHLDPDIMLHVQNLKEKKHE